LAHSTSSYPCPEDQLNLRMIPFLKKRYPNIVIGYSGHETGLSTTYAAVALEAAFVERHITLDRAMWGSDQAASVEIHGLVMMVNHIREIERSLGDGIKRVYKSELAAREKLRRFPNPHLSIA
ncbi:MAG: N-acetylneuraminate synthase family protein, partial [Candidatus Aminicenantes bacterium]|nr:N-acetylneuraminate synthase family protein [Candidatus Aminicenantes bacterium]